jgi:DNA polymerase III delta subunit
MTKWVQFYAKSKKIKISNDLIKFYIEYYGDNLSNVINEIDKHNMYNIGQPLGLSDEYSVFLESNRNYHYWQFLDNIGKKNLKKTLEIFQSLLTNGVSHNYIVNGLTNLLINIYSNKNYENITGKFPILNKILSKNIGMYSSRYSSQEIMSLFEDLYHIDRMIKRFQYGINYKIELMILKACNGYN